MNEMTSFSQKEIPAHQCSLTWLQIDTSVLTSGPKAVCLIRSDVNTDLLNHVPLPIANTPIVHTSPVPKIYQVSKIYQVFKIYQVSKIYQVPKIFISDVILWLQFVLPAQIPTTS
ncbi:hypothetical protein M8J76_017248 [Diaphorina citri]|nr:hypothetical protein M8J75_014072 [Diaphorina citri]KAI5737832.1 hypothetical protein M8J76_017248 [Diaphorina citri]